MGLLLGAALGLQHLLRRLEERADCVAHSDELSPGRYFQALEALYRENGAPMVGRRSPHPHLHDRLCAAGIAEDDAWLIAAGRWLESCRLGTATARPS